MMHIISGLRPGAPPMMGSRPQASAVPPKPPSKPGASIIEAKPQMRNLSADLTRFVPTTLKVKKDAHVPIIRKDVPKPSINPHIEWRSQTQAWNFCSSLINIPAVDINFLVRFIGDHKPSPCASSTACSNQG